jgi:phosphate starvation-inducible membrane PsiE
LFVEITKKLHKSKRDFASGNSFSIVWRFLFIEFIPIIIKNLKEEKMDNTTTLLKENGTTTLGW